MQDRIQLLNTRVDNLTLQEAVDRIDQLAVSGHNAYVVTPNVDHIVHLESDELFRKIYEDAALVLTDGKPLIWISKWIKHPIKEKVSGSDLFPAVCEMAAKKGYRLVLFGAAEGVADQAAERLTKKYPGLLVVGTYSPSYGFEKDAQELEKAYDFIRKTTPDILCVGLGSPKQEKFFYEARAYVQVPVTLHIGAAIDFEAGKVKRAPIWMQNAGLEWLYRLMKEPRRLFKRYIIDDMSIWKLYYKYKRKKGDKV